MLVKGGSSASMHTQKNVEGPTLPEGTQWERNVRNSFAGGKSDPVTYGGGKTLYRVGGKNGGLYLNFKNNANETLSNIILGELTTENTFGMESHFQMTVQGGTYHTKQVKKKLTMEDFLGIKEVTEETGMPVLEHIETIGEFASLFREDYDKMTEGKDVNSCLKEYMTMGEFDHKACHPGKDFLSGLLDITVVKPFVECLLSKDLITGEKLTETEKGFKMAGVCIDIVTLGQGALAIKGMEQAGKLTAKQALQMIGKTMALDAVSGAAAYTAGYAGEAIGLPPEITWMLSMVTGCGVSLAGGKYILKNAKGIVKEITAEEAGEIVEKGLKVVEKGGVNLVDDVVEGGSSASKPNQVHHYATDKNKTYTQAFEDITNKYELDLDADWNKELLPHQGRHPNDYHDYILEEMRNIDNIANGNKDIFLELYEGEIKSIIRDNPDMLYSSYWKGLKE